MHWAVLGCQDSGLISELALHHRKWTGGEQSSGTKATAGAGHGVMMGQPNMCSDVKFNHNTLMDNITFY